MKIGIDLDDVTINIMDGLLDYHNTKYNTKYIIDDHNFWDLDKVWGCTPIEAMQRVYDFYRTEHLENLLPIDGAVNAVNKLYKKHSLFFITSRPYFVKEKTELWLKKYFPDLDISLHFTNQYSPSGENKMKKSEVCKNVGVTIMIEDAPPNIYDLASNDIKVLLFTKPWNTKIVNSELITRVNSWKDVLNNLD